MREFRNLEKDLLSFIGSRAIGKIEPIELLAVVRKVEERGTYNVPHRVLSTARGVWRSQWQRLGQTETSLAILPGELGALIRVIRFYQGGPIVRAALQLAPILFQRPGEIQATAWYEIDLDVALWTIPVTRMKRKKEDKENGIPHYVPLPTQAV